MDSFSSQNRVVNNIRELFQMGSSFWGSLTRFNNSSWCFIFFFGRYLTFLWPLHACVIVSTYPEGLCYCLYCLLWFQLQRHYDISHLLSPAPWFSFRMFFFGFDSGKKTALASLLNYLYLVPLGLLAYFCKFNFILSFNNTVFWKINRVPSM